MAHLQHLNNFKTAPHTLSQEEKDVWVAKLIWIWRPARIIELRTRTGGGFLFLAELPPDVYLQVGVGAQGVDLCALFQGNSGLIWDINFGFCQPHSPVALQHGDSEDGFIDRAKDLMRRNCFLLKAPIEPTPQERRQWIEWLYQRANCGA